MKRGELIWLGLLFSISKLAQAEISDPCCGVKIWGYLDASYNYLGSNNQFTSETYNRIFDIQENGFILQQAALSLAYQPENGLGGLANVILGRDALTTAAFGYNPDIGTDKIGFDILQAYGQYAAGSITTMVGKYVTLAGLEVVDPTGNTNFSRSLLFSFAIPTTHMGIRGTYVFNNHYKFIAGVNNGWDNIRDPSRDKTIELGVVYTPTTSLLLSAQGYTGEERSISRTALEPTGRRNLIDLVATYNATDELSISANYDYGTQRNAIIDDEGSTSKVKWQGVAAYLNYKINDLWRLSIRGEDFSDSNGYRTGVEQIIRELTFTVEFTPIKNLELRAETRRDFSNADSYVNRHSGTARRFQQSFALEGIYKINNFSETPKIIPNMVVKERSLIIEPQKMQMIEAPRITQERPMNSLGKGPYTIQLLGASNEANVRKFISENLLENKCKYYRTTRAGKDWYVIVYGDYPSRHSAMEAIANLPPSLKKIRLNPWVRSKSDIQANIQ